MPCRTMDLRHQRPAHAVPGTIARHKKLVDGARRLQIGKPRYAAILLGHPQPVGVQTLGPLRGVAIRKRPSLQLLSGVVLVGEFVD